jgi:GTP-binding protein YchF
LKPWKSEWPDWEKESRSADKKVQAVAKALAPVLELLKNALQEGKPARGVELDEEQRLLIRDMHLITMKKMLYLCNVDEDGLAADNEYVRAVRSIAESEDAGVVTLCGQLEKEIADLETAEERAEFLADMGLEESGLSALIREGYELLGLRTFFTAGEKEVRAWTFHHGDKAPQAAGVIHTDFEKGFIKAETYHCDDLFELGSEQKIREAGKLRMEGKEYLVRDGDVMHFKFNV